MGFTVCKRSSGLTYLVVLLLLCIVQLANGTEDDLQKLTNLILGRLDDIDNKLESMDARLTQLKEEKSQLTFNPIDIRLFLGQEGQLDCGIIGAYRSCHWEHNGIIYQLNDVISGSHSDLKATYNSLTNQCGINITSVSLSHAGVWTCKAITSGPTITASKSLTIDACNPPCNNGGTCSGPSSCICTEAWKGPTCEISMCDSPCSNGGTCSGPNTCSCTKSWEGSTCQSPRCPDGFVKTTGSEQCFKMFTDKKRSWYDAKIKCESEGFHLAEPKGSVAVKLRKDLLDTFDDLTYAWLGAATDGSNWVWQHSNEILNSHTPLLYPYKGGITKLGLCLVMLISEYRWNSYPGKPYDERRCDLEKYTLCEA